MTVLDSASILRKSTAQVSCNLDEEVAILDLGKSLYFGLTGVGAHIWEVLETPRSVNEICDSVVATFDVAPEACRADVLKFLTSLEQAGLVEAAD